jgi:hypothetical protein
MPITVKHTKVSTIPDTDDTSLVRPSDWNADHTLTGLGTMAEQNANAVAITGGTITGVSGLVTSVTGTSPVVSSGGTTPAISMPAATGSVNGYLTSADWTTFNGKGSGTVTSVAATVPSFLSVTGSPITSSGTLALTYSGTALPVLNGGTGVTTSTGTGAVVLGTRPTISVTGTGLTLQDATDNTKTANFDLTGLTTATNYTYALPATSGSTIAVLAQAQTFSATQTFTTGVTMSGAGAAYNIGTSGTTGVTTIGGVNTTSILTVGRSTVSQTTNIQAGVTASGSTKTMNIGTAGAAGSTTTIAIGSTTGTSTTTVNGILKQQTYTVATLPSASTSGVGSRSFVTDALAPAFGATVVTGGAIAVPVYSDGTNWKVG